MRLASLLLASIAGSLAGASGAVAQTAPGYEPPKTAWGAPDLGGFWSNAALTALLPAGETAASAKAAAPEASMTQLAKAEPVRDNPFTVEIDKINARAQDDMRPIAGRCRILPSGGSGLNEDIYNNVYQIIQSPTHVMLLAETINDVRVIPVGVTHEAGKHVNESTAWYEGATLVVETVNMQSPQRADLTKANMSKAGKVTERFTRWSDDQIFYQFKVEDPSQHRQMRKGEMSFSSAEEPPHERICHQGNSGMQGIVDNARKSEAASRD